jgi:pimeloyl-ACP methyl ester carboxylesterase
LLKGNHVPISSLPLKALTLSDGACLNYVRAGAGPVLIMIHGVMGDYRSWAPQWEAFTRHFDCIAVSCRFNWPNGNTMEAPDHSAVENAKDVAEAMKQLDIDKAIIVGSSYGGFTGLALAVHHKEMVRAVVSVEPPMMKYAEMFADTAPVASAFRQQTVIPSREAFERGDDEVGAMLLTGGIQNQSIDNIPSQKWEQRRQNILAGKRVAMSSDEFPLLPPEALAALECPVLLVTGANTGPIFKAMMTGITRTMPQAECAVVEGAGHSVPQDQPEIFTPLALEFLQRNL